MNMFKLTKNKNLQMTTTKSTSGCTSCILYILRRRFKIRFLKNSIHSVRERTY